MREDNLLGKIFDKRYDSIKTLFGLPSNKKYKILIPIKHNPNSITDRCDVIMRKLKMSKFFDYIHGACQK